MTIKQLKDKGFSVWKKANNTFSLSIKNMDWYMCYAFYGEVKKISDTKFQFRDNKPTSNIDVLVNQISDYNDTLFRPIMYSDPMLRTGINDLWLIQDELKKVGFKRAGGTWEDMRENTWELSSKVFGSIFTIELYIKQKDDTRYFSLGYAMSGGNYPPMYYADCYGAESVLYLVNRMKTFILENTIKQLVSLYEKQIICNMDEVKVENQCVIAIDTSFRLWIDNKTWDQIEAGEKINMKPVAYFKNQQDFMLAADLGITANNDGLVKI